MEVHRIRTSTYESSWETQLYGSGSREGPKVKSQTSGRGRAGRTMKLVVGDCGSHVQRENAGKGKVGV